MLLIYVLFEHCLHARHQSSLSAWSGLICSWTLCSCQITGSISQRGDCATPNTLSPGASSFSPPSVHGRVCSWDFYLSGSLQHYPNKLAQSTLGIWGSLHLPSGGFASDGVGFPALYSETLCVFPKVRNHTSVTSRIVREGFLALTSSKDTKGDTQVCGLTSHCQQPQATGLELTLWLSSLEHGWESDLSIHLISSTFFPSSGDLSF